MIGIDLTYLPKDLPKNTPVALKNLTGILTHEIVIKDDNITPVLMYSCKEGVFGGTLKAESFLSLYLSELQIPMLTWKKFQSRFIQIPLECNHLKDKQLVVGGVVGTGETSNLESENRQFKDQYTARHSLLTLLAEKILQSKTEGIVQISIKKEKIGPFQYLRKLLTSCIGISKKIH